MINLNQSSLVFQFMKVNSMQKSMRFIEFLKSMLKSYHKPSFHFINYSFYFDFLILIIFELFIRCTLGIIALLLIFNLYIVASASIILIEHLSLDFFILGLLLNLLEIQLNFTSYLLITLNFLVDYLNRPLKFLFFSASLIDQIILFNELIFLADVNLQQN